MEKEKLPECPVEITLTLISSKWKLLIIRGLLAMATVKEGTGKQPRSCQVIYQERGEYQR